MNFLKKIFNSRTEKPSVLEKLMDKLQLEPIGSDVYELELSIANEFLFGTSEVLLIHKTDSIYSTFPLNFKLLDGKFCVPIFTNNNELTKFTKAPSQFTAIPTSKVYELCVHFNIETVVINIKSENRHIIEFNHPKTTNTNTDRYGELVEIGMDAYLSELENINWFNQKHSSKAEIKEKMDKCTNPKEYVLSLAQIEWDSEGFDDIDSYKKLFETFSIFIPDSKIKVINDGGKYLLTLKIKSKQFYTTLEINSDYFQESTILNEWINPALTEAGIDYKFYLLPCDDQILKLLYASDSIYNSAIEKGLIPPENYFVSE